MSIAASRKNGLGGREGRRGQCFKHTRTNSVLRDRVRGRRSTVFGQHKIGGDRIKKGRGKESSNALRRIWTRRERERRRSGCFVYLLWLWLCGVRLKNTQSASARAGSSHRARGRREDAVLLLIKRTRWCVCGGIRAARRAGLTSPRLLVKNIGASVARVRACVVVPVQCVRIFVHIYVEKRGIEKGADRHWGSSERQEG